jgi:hypothetical protein
VNGFGTDGIDVQANNVTISANYIGTGSGGKASVDNYLNGITVNGSNDTIGGVNTLNADGTIKVLQGNLVSGNYGNGIAVYGSNNLVEGNLIGTDITGKVGLGNLDDGVLIQGGSNNTIGGTVAGSGNVIANNSYGQGVAIVGSAPPPLTVGSQSAGTGQLSISGDAFNVGFTLSTFASGFTKSGTIGPLGMAFPTTGGVLVSDQLGNLRRFSSDTDGQTAGAATLLGANLGNANTEGLAVLGGSVYMSQETLGRVVRVSTTGATQFIASVPNAVGLTANPATGLLYASDKPDGVIYQVNPVTGVATQFAKV